MQLRVALAQTCPISASIPATRSASEVDSFMPFAELKANLADAKQWVEKAALDKADVVVFPEYFLQGIVDFGRQVGRHSEGISSITDILVSGVSSKLSP